MEHKQGLKCLKHLHLFKNYFEAGGPSESLHENVRPLKTGSFEMNVTGSYTFYG